MSRDKIERAGRAINTSYEWAFDRALQEAADTAVRDLATVEATELVRQALALRAAQSTSPAGDRRDT